LIGPENFHVISLGPNLTRASTHIQIPLSLVCTSIFVPLPACDHSQGVYFLPNRRRSIVFRVLFQQTNKQTNKILVYYSTFVQTNASLAQLQSFRDQLAIFTFDSVIFPTNLVCGFSNKEMKFQNNRAILVQIALLSIRQLRNQIQSIGTLTCVAATHKKTKNTGVYIALVRLHNRRVHVRAVSVFLKI